jgi:hypothetical protein
MNKGIFFQALEKKFARYRQGAIDDLEQIDTWPESEGNAVLSVALSDACQAQNFHVLTEARQAMMRMPREWLLANLPAQIGKTLDLDDEWEFRRLLEVLEEHSEAMCRIYVAKAQVSKNPEILELAQEYLEYFSGMNPIDGGV